MLACDCTAAACDCCGCGVCCKLAERLAAADRRRDRGRTVAVLNPLLAATAAAAAADDVLGSAALRVSMCVAGCSEIELLL
jgi:hypothetical protein